MPMLTKVFALVLLAAGAYSAELFSFGLKVGIPINSILTSAAPRFQLRAQRYTLGPTFELDLPRGLAFEVDVLYKRLEYIYSQPDSSIIQTTSATVKASRLELPVLLKYKIGGQHFQPFVDLGGSFNRVVHIEGMNVAELRHRHTRGVVIGAGLEKGFGAFRRTPESAKHILHIQKSLSQMNVQVHHVLSDITGFSGMMILDAILAGERDCLRLAQLCRPSVKSPREKVAQALEGDYRPEHLFTLRQSLAGYRYYQQQIAELDDEIQRLMKALPSSPDAGEQIPERTKRTRYQRQDNDPGFNLRAELYRIAGVDLTDIPGVSAMTAGDSH
jgi:hypothetical protein